MSKTTTARLEIVVVRGLGAATLVATALAVAPQFLSSAPASNSVVDDDAVIAAIEDCQSSLDGLWTDPDASTGSVLTSAQSIAIEVRDGMSEDGTPVTSATSEVSLVQATARDDGMVLAEVDVSTTFTYEGMGDSEAPGVWSDRHSVELSANGSGGFSVVEDTVEGSEAAAKTGDVPGDYAPRRSLDTRSRSSSVGGLLVHRSGRVTR